MARREPHPGAHPTAPHTMSPTHDQIASEPPPVPTVVDLLERTHVAWDLHRWPTHGGSITLTTAELRPALEAAFDPSMPDWPALVELADA